MAHEPNHHVEQPPASPLSNLCPSTLSTLSIFPSLSHPASYPASHQPPIHLPIPPHLVPCPACHPFSIHPPKGQCPKPSLHFATPPSALFSFLSFTGPATHTCLELSLSAPCSPHVYLVLSLQHQRLCPQEGASVPTTEPAPVRGPGAVAGPPSHRVLPSGVHSWWWREQCHLRGKHSGLALGGHN